jgi:hypothetical protein
MTIYPSYSEYNLSVRHLSRFTREPRLQAAQPYGLPNGGLTAYSGGYSRVYPVASGGRRFALRCWTADVGDARERYRRIDAYLRQQTLPYFVEFEYLEDAIVVKGKHYPVLWMEWAEGPRLREFVGQNLGNRNALRALAAAFREMVGGLHAARISHGDLQDENIIVQPTPAGPTLKLIDYDSLFVPSLAGFADQIIGVSHYQHPRRSALRVACEHVDYFSECVIYLSLLAYAESPNLWNAHAEKRLLFADEDFLDPLRAPSFRDLRFMTGEVRVLTDRLIDFCREPDILRLLPLEAVSAVAPSASSAPPPVRSSVPWDLLATPGAPAGAPAPPPSTVPDGLLSTGGTAPPGSATGPPAAPVGWLAAAPSGGVATSAPPASAPARPASRPGTGWASFLDAAQRTATAPTALVAAGTVVPVAGGQAPAPTVAPAPAQGGALDGWMVGVGFGVGLLLIFAVFLVLYLLLAGG